MEAARAAGVDVKMEERFMNKANGVEGCPFLKHLVGNGPYISIGPNDTATIIHEANESIPLVNSPEQQCYSAMSY